MSCRKRGLPDRFRTKERVYSVFPSQPIRTPEKKQFGMAGKPFLMDPIPVVVDRPNGATFSEGFRTSIRGYYLTDLAVFSTSDFLERDLGER